jgi:hypothetical protein
VKNTDCHLTYGSPQNFHLSYLHERYASNERTRATFLLIKKSRTWLIVLWYCNLQIFGLEPGKRSRYSDWLRAGQIRGRNSSPGRVKNFLFSKSSRQALGSTQPPIQWVPGALSPRVKRPGREADHSPRASAEVKKMWIYTSTPP